MNVAVIGIGRIGLPIAVALAARGHSVVGCDIDARRVEFVNQGRNPIPDEAGLADLLLRVVGEGRLRATTDTPAAVAGADVVAFCVAVDVDAEGRADLRPLLAACDAAAPALRPGSLCIFDTTLPVGTTRNVLVPRLAAGGRMPGRDLFVAFSPERLFMGRVLRDLTAYPKVVGGYDAESARRAVAFYRETLGVDIIELPSLEAAELSKLAEGVYRDLNIALANELAQVADRFGIDVMDVIRAANSQPYCHLHIPGTGVGGHCIPVYPRFLMQGEGPSRLAALGRRVNDEMPAYAVERLGATLGGLEGKRIVVLGLAFRPDVAVTAHTNALDLLRELRARGAKVWGHDPLLDREAIEALGFDPAPEPPRGYDAAVVHALHAAYRDLEWGKVAPLVFDARNALEPAVVTAAGAAYIGVGRPLRRP
ncbi:UDP-N-acetyl-D-glucosamine 6-dehydrogenase [bacterium HR29]|jgi:nucleotide sugar dehydrogenase|nr:UDP-N-acetyl-D-glucosamine 6-dehydrogenase [bacterium HR29]